MFGVAPGGRGGKVILVLWAAAVVAFLAIVFMVTAAIDLWWRTPKAKRKWTADEVVGKLTGYGVRFKLTDQFIHTADEHKYEPVVAWAKLAVGRKFCPDGAMSDGEDAVAWLGLSDKEAELIQSAATFTPTLDNENLVDWAKARPDDFAKICSLRMALLALCEKGPARREQEHKLAGTARHALEMMGDDTWGESEPTDLLSHMAYIARLRNRSQVLAEIERLGRGDGFAPSTKQVEIYRAAVRIWCVRGQTQTEAVYDANSIWDEVREMLEGEK